MLRHPILWWRYDRRWYVNHYRDKLLMWIAWRMPRPIVYWCFIRVASFGEASWTVLDSLKYWESWKGNATEARKFAESHLQQHQDGDRLWSAAQTGDSDSSPEGG